MIVHIGRQMDDVGESIIKSIEQDSQKKIFTYRVMDKNEEELTFEMVIVFEDKSVMMGFVSIETIAGKWSPRFRGNYI